MVVGGWTNRFEKYARQNGNLPQIGVNIKKKTIWNHHQVLVEFLLVFDSTTKTTTNPCTAPLWKGIHRHQHFR